MGRTLAAGPAAECVAEDRQQTELAAATDAGDDLNARCVLQFQQALKILQADDSFRNAVLRFQKWSKQKVLKLNTVWHKSKGKARGTSNVLCRLYPKSTAIR